MHPHQLPPTITNRHRSSTPHLPPISPPLILPISSTTQNTFHHFHPTAKCLNHHAKCLISNSRLYHLHQPITINTDINLTSPSSSPVGHDCARSAVPLPNPVTRSVSRRVFLVEGCGKEGFSRWLTGRSWSHDGQRVTTSHAGLGSHDGGWAGDREKRG